MGYFLFFHLLLLCFVLLSHSFSSSLVSHHHCSPSEASALLQFKQPFKTSGDSSSCYKKRISWNESRDCCTWGGVTCDMFTGYVIGLDLSCSRIIGAIHPNSTLFQLQHLQTLNLAYNDFSSSSIPNGIGHLRNLRHLDLFDSRFQGKIPTEITYLSNLVSLDISYVSCEFDQKTFEALLQNLTKLEIISLRNANILSPIPMNMSSSLRYVDLAYTNLQAGLLESFFLLPYLISLSLCGNDLLEGALPKIIHSSNMLSELDIASAKISGPIPDSIGNLTQIRKFILSDNNFIGRIPSTISNLKQLTYLDLSSNSLGGEIPDVFSKLNQLTRLDLSYNSLKGKIPDVFSNIQELVELSLNDNSITGQFPSSTLSLRRLKHLDLSSNSLSGSLPCSVSMLQNLNFLGLSDNSLNGTIPSWVFSLPLLTSDLYLHHNQFSGLADDLKTNTVLGVLDLSHNQLRGPILQSAAQLINLVSLDLSANNIIDVDGTGIEALKTMHKLESIFLSYNPLSWSWRTNFTVSKIIFPRLTNLELSSCGVEDFPYFLRNSKSLQVLDLSDNKIHGQIPNWFSNMRWDSLWYLNLSHNSLTGHLDELHYYNLQALDLKYNFLQGPLPSSICNLSNLQFLDVSHNNFSDSIPHCFGSMAELLVLALRRNNFRGSMPPFRSTSLKTIALDGNQLEGPVPVSLLNCHGLEILDLGSNVIVDKFPAWLGTLEYLQVLILKSNKFYGPISACHTKFCFPRLRIFDLSHNEFYGSLPAKVFNDFRAMITLDGADKGGIEYMQAFFFKNPNIMYEDSVRLVIKGQDIELQRIATILTAIDLSSNHFEGVIPKTLKDLASLRLLNLSRNNLKGDITMELGKLNKLEALDLSWNQLDGKIPQELTRLTFLSLLNLSQNLLVGPIPQGAQFSTFSKDSYGGNIDLCGPPLSKQCGRDDSSHVESEEEDDGSVFFSGFTWESVVIGYACGLVGGFIIWSTMFEVGKPRWFVEFFEGIMPKETRRPKKRAHQRRRRIW